jgi:hypothetical protein
MSDDRTRSGARVDDAAFRVLVGSVVDYAIYMLDPEGNVTSWNAGAERIGAEELVTRCVQTRAQPGNFR